MLSPQVGLTTQLVAVYALEPYILRFWDMQEGTVVGEMQDQPGGAVADNVSVIFGPEEKYLAVGGDPWGLASGEHLATTEQVIGEKTTCWPYHTAFSPQGITLGAGCFDGRLDVWQIPDGGLEKSFGGYRSWFNEIAFSPDGEYLAAIYNVPHNLVHAWHALGGNHEFSLRGDHFTRAAYSPDGLLLATVLAQQEFDQYGWPAGVVQLWYAGNGEQINQFDLEDAVRSTFSLDSQVLATSSL